MSCTYISPVEISFLPLAGRVEVFEDLRRSLERQEAQGLRWVCGIQCMMGSCRYGCDTVRVDGSGWNSSNLTALGTWQKDDGNTLPETNSEFTPENGWLEYRFPFGFRPIFRGAWVSFRECSSM